MDPNIITTTFIAEHGRCSPLYFLALIKFYLGAILLYPIAYLGNQSFILRHPNQLLPVPIAPPWNKTIHSFHLDTDMHNCLSQYFPYPPRQRQWL